MTALSHARFQRLATPADKQGTSLFVQYNPAELAFAKGAQVAEIPVPGLDTPLLQFVRGQAETLTVELFFDSTEDGTGPAAKPVTTLTDEFYDLIKIDPKTHAPPVLLFTWGGTAFPGHRREGFRCVVTSVRQQFTMFAPDGKPLRARLTVELKEYKPLAQQLHELGLESADHTKSVVFRDGDTITGIAYSEYGDDRAWRRIADENRVDDPLAVTAGAILRVPRGLSG
jgi:nucleoid-associated protein YgaU